MRRILRLLTGTPLDVLLCACWLLVLVLGIVLSQWADVRTASLAAVSHVLINVLLERIRKLEQRNAQLERAVRIETRPDGSIFVAVDATAWQQSREEEMSDGRRAADIDPV